MTAKLVERNITTAQQEPLGHPRRGEASEAKGALSGVRVEDLTPELAQELKLPSSAHGVVVSSVDPDSNAAVRGLRRGDLIEEVNRQPVSNREELNAALEKAGKKSVILLIRPRGVAGTSVIVVPAQD